MDAFNRIKYTTQQCSVKSSWCTKTFGLPSNPPTTNSPLHGVLSTLRCVMSRASREQKRRRTPPSTCHLQH